MIMKEKSNEVIYCEDCGKYFDTEEEKEEHKSTNHSGSQSKLFEQVTPIFSDHQDITLDDKVDFSLPPPRGEFDYQEGKLNWEGLFDEDRIDVLLHLAKDQSSLINELIPNDSIKSIESLPDNFENGAGIPLYWKNTLQNLE